MVLRSKMFRFPGVLPGPGVLWTPRTPLARTLWLGSFAYTGLKFAGWTIGSRKQRRVGTAAGVHATEVSLAGFHRRGLLVAHKSHRRASFATLLTPKGVNMSILK